MACGMRVSVLIPAYNAAHCIDRALASVSAQTWPLHEVIVVDDGSQDNTQGVVGAWASKLPLRVIALSSNVGVSKALQRGVEQANGDWICRLDADDRWWPEHVAKLVGAMSPGVVLVSAAAQWVDEQGQPGSRSTVPAASQVRARLMWDNPLVHSATAFNRAACLDVGGYRADIKWEDYDLWIRLLQAGEFGPVHEATMDYTVSSSSVSRGHKGQALDARWRCQRLALQSFWRQHPIDALCCGALGGLRHWWRRVA
jgi:glycosyltransferase involved in cell wall biosynthesis